MSDRSFSRRRRSGQRFRPNKTQSFKPERAAIEARAEVLGDKPSAENVFDSKRHEREIERSENRAAGLAEGRHRFSRPAARSRNLSANGITANLIWTHRPRSRNPPRPKANPSRWPDRRRASWAPFAPSLTG